jgi:hypothetical protein
MVSGCELLDTVEAAHIQQHRASKTPTSKTGYFCGLISTLYSTSTSSGPCLFPPMLPLPAIAFFDGVKLVYHSHLNGP